LLKELYLYTDAANQLLLDCLVLTFFIMAPTFTEINDKALSPILMVRSQSTVFRQKYGTNEELCLTDKRKGYCLFVKLAKMKSPVQKGIPSYCLILLSD
jgi:flagellar biosynthesis protein FliP